jgi:hypothetical protein
MPSLTDSIVSHGQAYTRPVLILPPGHAQTLRLRTLSPREKWMVRGVAAAAAVIAIVVVVALATSGPASSRGCIHATIPGAVGAQAIDQCGAAARETCVTVRAPGAYTSQAESVIETACRRASLPVGR